MKNWWLPVIGVVSFGGGWLLMDVASRPAAALNMKRTALIEELDKGFLVSCSQVNNPYPFSRHSADVLADAKGISDRCFGKGAGLSTDRTRK